LDDKTNPETNRTNKHLLHFGIVTALSAVWLALRSGFKPTRLQYPCQRAAISNLEVFKIVVLSAFPSITSFLNGKKAKTLIVAGALVFGSVFLSTELAQFESYFSNYSDSSRIPIDLAEHTSAVENPSNLFYVTNASGEDGNMDLAVATLLSMLSSNNESFYHTSENSGLIDSNDVIVLKVNAQWNYRGSTNKDLVRSVIQAILDHPDGFTGEIVVCDNGQARGNFEYESPNAFNHSQNMQEVVNSFASYPVSTFLWDTIRRSYVDEYFLGDNSNGYVLSDNFISDTRIYVSYPKFRTSFGTNISLRMGIYNGTDYDSDRLKIINMPVMKSHFRYGVTGCVKNYMGVPMGEVVPSIHSSIPHEHFSIGLGGMGTLMGEVRAPVLNILDMVWVNPHPMESSTRRGPWSTYSNARFTDIIAASQDPVALDYWSSKNVLCEAASYLNYTEYSSLDPDYAPLSDQYYGYDPMDESFHNYLNRSRMELQDYGFQFTMDPDAMNVFVTEISHPSTTDSTTPPPFPWDDGLGTVIIVLISSTVGVVLVIAIIRIKKK